MFSRQRNSSITRFAPTRFSLTRFSPRFFLQSIALVLLLMNCVSSPFVNLYVLRIMAERRAASWNEIQKNRAAGRERVTAKNIELSDAYAILWDAGESDRRLKSVAHALPLRGTFGYISDTKMSTRLYYLAQYSLAPRVLFYSSQPQWILVEFTSPACYRQAQQDRVLDRWVEERDHAPVARWRGDNSWHRVVAPREALVLVRDLGNGLMLFRQPTLRSASRQTAP